MTPVATVAGPPGLGAEIRELLADSREELGLPEASSREYADLEAVTRAALTVLRNPSRTGADRERALDLGTRAQDLLHVLHEQRREYRDALLSEVQQGLQRLAPITSSAELLDRVCAEAKRSCGLERILLSRVHGGAWRPWMIDFSDDRGVEQQMIAAMRDSAIDLDDSPIEREILAGRRPAIVGRVKPGHSYASILGISRSASYVVVPVAPAGRVVGLLHADHGADGPRVDIVDRDVLWVFAEGFGRIYERTELQERLRAQLDCVHDAFEVLETTIAAVGTTEIGLGDSAAAARAYAGDDVPPSAPLPNSTIDELLTKREREVLEQMMLGLNNAAIAERLVIGEGTVKSHVKHILRKLGAVNRTEAISRYLDGGAGGRG
jgi:LuxR family transcriptional regulator, regulator of acetate metabolism